MPINGQVTCKNSTEVLYCAFARIMLLFIILKNCVCVYYIDAGLTEKKRPIFYGEKKMKITIRYISVTFL